MALQSAGCTISYGLHPESRTLLRTFGFLGYDFFFPPEFILGCGSDVADEHLAYVRDFRQGGDRGLRIQLQETRIGDAGVENLAGVQRIEALCLDSTNITDAGLESMSGLRNLRVLSLDHTSVSDDGLVNLKGMAQLEYLNIDGTSVTHKGIAFIEEVLPDCQINALIILPYRKSSEEGGVAPRPVNALERGD